MKPLAKYFAAAAVLAAVSLTASSCDTSPYAAVANSHTIKQTAFNAELSAWAGNAQYVRAFDSANGSSGVTVAGFAPGTYNSGWVATILNNTVVATLVHQRLHQLGQAPDRESLEGARAVSEISQIGWNSFSPGFRDTLARRLAEDATLTPPSINTATLQRVYQQYQKYFFSRVCLLQAAAFSLEQAQRLSSNSYPGGTQVCYDQAQFENQSSDFRQAVIDLGLYKVSQPIKTRYGYQVVEVVSRDALGFTPQLQRAISVAILNAQGAPNPEVDQLRTAARVKVNPQYGSWVQGQVSPPKTPGSSQ